MKHSLQRKATRYSDRSRFSPSLRYVRERVTRTAKIRDSSRHAHLHRPSIGSGGCGVKLFRLSNGWLYERVKYIATLAICCKSGWLQFFSLWLDLLPPFATSVTKCHQSSTDDLNTTIKLDGFDGISIRFAGLLAIRLNACLVSLATEAANSG